MEDGVDGEGKDGKRDLAREEPCEGHDWASVSTCYSWRVLYCLELTQVLHIFVSSKSNNTALLACPHAGAVRLVDDDAVRDASR